MGCRGVVGEGAITKPQSWGACPHGGHVRSGAADSFKRSSFQDRGSPWNTVPGVRHGPACPFRPERPRVHEAPLLTVPMGADGPPGPPGLPESILQLLSAVPPGGISQKPLSTSRAVSSRQT